MQPVLLYDGYRPGTRVHAIPRESEGEREESEEGRQTTFPSDREHTKGGGGA